MNATTLNTLLGKFLSAEMQHAVVLAAHLLLMMHHGDATPLEAAHSGRRDTRHTLHLSRSL